MRGASAVDGILKRRAAANIRVFAIWQPMLATDFAPPISFVLGRLSDRRVQQYWDPEHALALQLSKDARAPQPEPECCDRDGILWDLAAVYPAGLTWEERLPPATIFSGPVIDVASTIDTALGSGSQ
jgi:hypothetical protein